MNLFTFISFFIFELTSKIIQYKSHIIYFLVLFYVINSYFNKHLKTEIPIKQHTPTIQILPLENIKISQDLYQKLQRQSIQYGIYINAVLLDKLNRSNITIFARQAIVKSTWQPHLSIQNNYENHYYDKGLSLSYNEKPFQLVKKEILSSSKQDAELLYSMPYQSGYLFFYSFETNLLTKPKNKILGKYKYQFDDSYIVRAKIKIDNTLIIPDSLNQNHYPKFDSSDIEWLSAHNCKKCQ